MSTILQGRPVAGVLINRRTWAVREFSTRRTLDYDVAVLAEGRALHGVGLGGTGTSLMTRCRQIFGNPDGFTPKNVTDLLDNLVVFLIIGHA